MLEQKLKELLGLQVGVDPTQIKLTDQLVNDLNADSLDLVEIVMTIEETFNIIIEEDEYHTCNTVELVLNLIQSKLGN
jgi:acyl carrier protein